MTTTPSQDNGDQSGQQRELLRIVKGIDRSEIEREKGFQKIGGVVPDDDAHSEQYVRSSGDVVADGGDLPRVYCHVERGNNEERQRQAQYFTKSWAFPEYEYEYGTDHRKHDRHRFAQQ